MHSAKELQKQNSIEILNFHATLIVIDSRWRSVGESTKGLGDADKWKMVTMLSILWWWLTILGWWLQLKKLPNYLSDEWQQNTIFLPSSAQAPASQSPAGGLRYPYSHRCGEPTPTPTPTPFTRNSSFACLCHIITTVGTCSWLINNLFTTYLWLAYHLFMTFS